MNISNARCKRRCHSKSYLLSGLNAIYITQALFNGCFYGVKAIFVLYAIHHYSFSETEAIGLFVAFMTLCYGTSLIGGYIADHGMGVKNTIMLGGILSSLGLLCILWPSQDAFFLGLALASLGSGFSKPNISAALGLLFKDPKDPSKDRAYSIFYMAMNFGGLVFPVSCGFVGQTYGGNYGVALIAAILMGATCFVYKTMRFHPSHTEKPIPFGNRIFWGILFLTILLYLLFRYRDYFHGLMGIITGGSIIYLGKIICQCTPQERKDVSRVILYALSFSLFCALFEQAGTSMMLFYEKAIDRNVMGTVIPPSAFLSLDPLLILVFGPVFLFLSGRCLERKKPIEGFVKIGCGFLGAALCFGILALSAYLSHGALISPLWIIGAGLIQVMAEFWVAPVSFAKISQYAPPRYQSVLMSFWLMAIAYGHYFAGFIAQFSLSGAIPWADSSVMAGGTAFLQHCKKKRKIPAGNRRQNSFNLQPFYPEGPISGGQP
jgi:POT family proton-dependent oligopeptide transporter